MGSENLFHKRKGKTTKSLSRRGATRESVPTYLIVCEGKKTEPEYFNDLRNHERLASITVRVCGECGSAPISVVQHALQLYNDMIKEGETVEQIFCVFDKDVHESFFRACALIEKSKNEKIPITAVFSIPCFEYWLLLHFQYNRAPFQGKGNSSIAGVVCKQVQIHIKGYTKGIKGLYASLKPKQADAIAHSQRAIEDMNETGQENPSTHVHTLVEELLKFSDT
ncbi:MAG: RloB domain-containing protein [Pseudomonas lactis]|nr:RloB domain-containing protein [Pseudomonas lactis]